ARLFAEAGSAASAPVIRALDRAAEAERTRLGCEGQVRGQLLIVIDQLDELFGPDLAPELRAAFARLLTVLAETGRVWLLATLRADLYERFLVEPGLLASRQAERRTISRPRVRRSWLRSSANRRKPPSSSSRRMRRPAKGSTSACCARPIGPT